jgi:hypothetical protein
MDKTSKYNSLCRLQCNVCHQRFARKWDLDIHSYNSHQEYKCDMCDQIFTNSSDRTEHELSVHEDQMIILNISSTGEIVPEVEKVKQPEITVVYVKPKAYPANCTRTMDNTCICDCLCCFKCNVCQQRFDRKWDLDIHSYNSHQEYKCDMCDQNFSNSSDRSTHYMNVHKDQMIILNISSSGEVLPEVEKVIQPRIKRKAIKLLPMKKKKNV